MTRIGTDSVSSPAPPAPPDAFENWNCCSKFVNCLAFVTGGVITLFCGFMVGLFFAVTAVSAMLRVCMRNKEWLKRWQHMETSGIIVNGTVVSREHAIDEITGFHTYSVTIKYDGSIVTDEEEVAASSSGHPTKATPRASTTNTKCLHSLTDGAKEIYEFTEFETIVPLHMLHGHPNAAIPNVVLQRKIADIYFWTVYGDLSLAFCGVLAYLACSEFYLSLVKDTLFESYDYFWCTIIYRAATIGGVLLMVPTLYVHTRFQFKKDQQTFLEEPASMLTQTDWLRVAWHKMGPTGWKKVWFVASIPGWCLVSTMAAIVGVFFAPWGVYCMIYTLKFGPKWKVFLQDFKRDSIVAHGVVIVHSRTVTSNGDGGGSTEKFFVKARYRVALPNDFGYYTVMTSTESKVCYFSCSLHGSVNLYVNPEIPRSGWIDSDLRDMMFQACLWNWFWAPLLSVIGLGTTFGLAYLDLVYDGSSSLFFTALGIVLVAPQTYVLAENNFNKAKKSLLEKGEIEPIFDIVPDVIPRSDSPELELTTAKMLS